jgi:hypothetical protein
LISDSIRVWRDEEDGKDKDADVEKCTRNSKFIIMINFESDGDLEVLFITADQNTLRYLRNTMRIH